MERTSSWLVSMFIIMFWVFRLLVAISAQSGNDFGGFTVIDFNKEIILLFVTVLSFALIVKRKMLGAILYIITYGYYFGGNIVANLLPIITSGSQLDMNLSQNLLVSIVAIFVSIFAFLDLLIEKMKKNKYTDSKTDWFFDNKDIDRKKDERADENHYKFY